jgi:hypothetical protein
MVDKTKVMNGPFSVDFLDGAGESVLTTPITGRLKDAISLSTENLSEDLEDGSRDVYAKKLTCDITLSELDTAREDEIEDSSVASMEVSFTAKGRKLVVDTPNTITTSLDGLKTKISIEKVDYSGGRPYSVTDII